MPLILSATFLWLSLLSNAVQMLSTESILPLFFPRWRFFLFDSWPILPSQFFHSRVWSCASWSSDQHVVLPSSSIFDSSAILYLDSILDCTKPTQSEVGRNPATSFCTNLPGPSREVTHLFLIEFGPIVSASPTPSLCKQMLNRSDRPWASNLYSSQRVDCVFELAALQRWLSLWKRYWWWSFSTQTQSSRFKHFKIREVSSPFNWFAMSTWLIHDIVSWGNCVLTHTHSGLEVDSPTLKITWVWEFSGMQFRDSVPRCFHHTILGNKFLQYDTKVFRSHISW